MKTFYVIRSGWNAANQSAMGRPANPANQFESGQYALVGIVEAQDGEEAVQRVQATCYNNQCVWAETNPRAIKGLTAEIRRFGGSR